MKAGPGTQVCSGLIAGERWQRQDRGRWTSAKNVTPTRFSKNLRSWRDKCGTNPRVLTRAVVSASQFVAAFKFIGWAYIDTLAIP